MTTAPAKAIAVNPFDRRNWSPPLAEADEAKTETPPVGGGVRQCNCRKVDDMVLNLAFAGKRLLEHIIREGRLRIGPELAQRILSEALYKNQRKVYRHHVVLLADDMRRKRWTAGSQICFVLFHGRLYLVNGQHRLHAVIESGEEIEFQILIEAADDEAQLAAIYYRFDRKQRARTTAEVLNAAGVAERFGLSKTAAKATFEAAGLISNGFRRANYQQDPLKARSDDLRLDAARAWWEFGAEYDRLIEPADKVTKGKLFSSGVVAVALVTLKYQQERAVSFWGGLAEDDGLRSGDPRKTLRRDLLNRSLSSGSPITPVQVPALAWNAFYAGRSLKIIKVYDEAAVRIAGTPFDGRRG